MAEPNFDPSRICDADLCRFASSDQQQSQSIIVEMQSDVEVTFAPSPRHPSGKRPRRIVGPDPAQTRKRLDQLAKTIGKLVDGELVKIDVAEAIVADVTPSQLRAIAALDDVAAIRPNRTHQVR